jgi:hypothetical protein
MKNQTGLLPWVLGGLSVAAVAVVITVASAGKTAAPSLSPEGAASAQAAAPNSPSLPAASSAATVATEPAVATVAAAPAVVPTSVPDPETVPPPAAQAQEPAVQSGQIWQCVTNGVKTFSNNPCGEKSSLLEVRAINTMNPTPVARYARTYAPQQYSPAYADQNTYSDEDAYGEQGADTAANSYTVVQGVAFLPRRRPDHPHHRPPFHHNPGDNPGHHPGHDSGDNPGRNPGHNPPRRN